MCFLFIAAVDFRFARFAWPVKIVCGYLFERSDGYAYVLLGFPIIAIVHWCVPASDMHCLLGLSILVCTGILLECSVQVFYCKYGKLRQSLLFLFNFSF